MSKMTRIAKIADTPSADQIEAWDADVIAGMYGRQPSWLTEKALPDAKRVAGEALRTIAFMFQTHDDPKLGADPLTGLPRKRFGIDIIGEHLYNMVRADYDAFWDKEQLGILSQFQIAQRQLVDAMEAEGIPFDSSQDYVKMLLPEHYQMFIDAQDALSERNETWMGNSFSMGMMKDILDKYGSQEAVIDMMVNRPAEMLVDIADIWTPHLPVGVVAKLRRATPDNVDQIIDEILDYATMPQKIDIDQLRRWNEDEDTFFRLTTRNRLDQEYSLAIGESDGLAERFHWDTIRYLEQRDKLYDSGWEPLLSHADVFDESGDMILDEDIYKTKWHDESGGEVIDEDWELEEAYWDRYQEIAWMEGVTPIKPIPLEEVPSSAYPDFSKFRYAGVNAVMNLNQLAEYQRHTGWTDFIHDPDSETVIEVITGWDSGEAIGGLNPDSVVIDSPKRIAILDPKILEHIPEDEDFSLFNDRFLDIESEIPDELVDFLESIKNRSRETD